MAEIHRIGKWTALSALDEAKADTMNGRL